jgi:predicted PurR-regulated permease PerM
MTDLTPGSAPAPDSPKWNTATKFLVALVALVTVGSLLERFQEMVGPLVFAFILAYLLNPAIEWLTAKARLSWGMAVNLAYLALVVVILGLLTAAGIAIEQQIVGLYNSVTEILPDLPARIETFLRQPWAIGPFTFTLSTADLRPLFDQITAALEPILSQTGAAIGSLASGTAAALGWLLFILIISFYLLHDLKKVTPSIEQIVPAGYVPDVRRLMAELGPIWNAFLRGQITVSLTLGLLDGIALTLLGVRYAPVLGLLAAVLVFIPFVGPTITFTVIVLVALFQPGNWLGLSPGYYVLLVILVYLILQQVYDNILYPRILGHSLNLHPIIILVGAIVATSYAGIVGLLLAAPLIATLRLFGRYVYRMVFDLDPWPPPPPAPPLPPRDTWFWLRWINRLRRRVTDDEGRRTEA